MNPDRIGHRYPTYRYEVGREKVREYARAVGAGEVPDTGAVLAPPAFAACFTLNRLDDVVGDPDLGAHWNLVHASQEYDFHRPVVVGDVLACTPTITDIRDLRRMQRLTLQTDCVDAETGEQVVTSRAEVLFLAPTAQEAAAGAGGA